MKTLFKNANLINELGDVLTGKDMLIADGKIAQIGETCSVKMHRLSIAQINSSHLVLHQCITTAQ